MKYKLYLSIFLASLLGAKAIHAQGLDALFTQQSTGAIININTITGASTTLYTATGMNWNGAAYDQNNHLLYISDIGRNGYTPGTIITNTIYSFDPFNPTGGVTEVGTITGQAAFTGAGFHNGLYYAIGSGSNQLVAYDFTGHSGAGVITATSTQTLGGLASGVTGLSLGDIDFVGNTLYISSGTVSGGTTVSTIYNLYKYATVANTTAPDYTFSEGTEVGVGIANDINSGLLIMFNSDGTIATVDPSSGMESGSIKLQGDAASGGAGDFTIVPEPRAYALTLLVLLFGLIAAHRMTQSRLQTSLA